MGLARLHEALGEGLELYLLWLYLLWLYLLWLYLLWLYLHESPGEGLEAA